jgi:hypothetical protein
MSSASWWRRPIRTCRRPRLSRLAFGSVLFGRYPSRPTAVVRIQPARGSVRRTNAQYAKGPSTHTSPSLFQAVAGTLLIVVV